MEHYLNSRVQSLQGSGIRKIANMVRDDPRVIDMTLGQPDFPTPERIKAAGKKAIDDNRTAYTESPGLFALRKAASDYMWRRYGLSYRPEDEVIVTAGASEAIDIALRTILEEGSEVIVPGPIYPGYEPIIRMCGATPVYIDSRENDFKVNAAMIKEKITDNTRCIVLSYPSNPTGRTLNAKEMADIAALVQDKNIFIVSDEIYSELVYGQAHHSIASSPEIREQSIIINGLSKSHAMTGWRLGFAFAPAYILSEMAKVHLFNTVCASTVSQYAAITALTQALDDDVKAMREEYRRRRDYVYARAAAMGLEVTKPEGAFYLFPSIKHTGMTSQNFAIGLLEKEKVAVVPGSAFSPFGEGYIRISYACSMETLEEGMSRLENFLKQVA